MHPYTNANYMVNNLTKLRKKAFDAIKQNNEYVDDVEIKNGMFVIVPYDFATTSSNKQSTKNLLALVLANDKTLEVQYGKSVGQSLKRFMLVPNDKGQVAKTDIVSILPYPILKRGVYEFPEDICVDIV